MKTHGMSRHPLYGTWSGMMNRCYNWKTPQFECWGGRGISVDLRWHDVRLFIADIEASIGPRPPGMTLDRTDNDSDYGPGKVRWATRAQQVQNSRSFVDGTRSDPMYRIWWRIMRQPDDVCPEWHDLDVFRSDAGPKPEGRRLVRTDSTCPWGPGNTRWLTGIEQIKVARLVRLSRPYPAKHGLSAHPLYRTWERITREYPEALHEPWLDIRQFIADASAVGPRPAGSVFRRIDPGGRFEPGNVCWGKAGRPTRG